MIRRLCVPLSRCGGFIRPIAVVLFTSAAVVLAWTTISSISAAPLGKEQDRARTVAQIHSILSAQQDAWNRGDIDGFMNGYARSRSTIFVSEDAVRRGWETVRARYKKKYSDRGKMGQLTFSDLEITPVSSDTAVVLGGWKLKRAQDWPHGRFTLIFRRLPEGWRIVHDHTSAAKE
jgi:ketosteroid isomerase-like protein